MSGNAHMSKCKMWHKESKFDNIATRRIFQFLFKNGLQILQVSLSIFSYLCLKLKGKGERENFACLLKLTLGKKNKSTILRFLGLPFIMTIDFTFM